MSFLRSLQALLCTMILMLIQTLSAAAVPALQPSQSELALVTSLASMASYDGEWNLLTRDRLRAAGWTIETYEHRVGSAQGRFHLLTRPDAAILAFPGTERKADAAIDLRIQRIPFGGRTPEQFAEIAASQADATALLVHRGFDEYTRAALFTEKLADRGNLTTGESIVKTLLEHPDWPLLITGHSLGGAAATLAAARFSDMGIPASQLNVITYGAPAVGNEAFAKTYEPNMQLTRYTIDYDPVHTVLQSMYRGFAQFGTRVEWKKDRKVDMFPHNMTVYLDKVLRSYYDDPNRTKTLLYGTPMQTAGVLMAPIAFKMEDYLKEDQTYMDKALTDNIGSEYTDVRIAKHADMPNLTQEAKAQNCVYILRQRYTSERMRKSKDLMYHISLEEELCDRDGNVLTVQNLSTNTKNLTPLESVIYLQEQAKEQRSVFLSAPKFK